MLADLRHAFQHPVFAGNPPDIHELQAALDHAPALVRDFLTLFRNHRATLDNIMRLGREKMPEEFLALSPETTIHDFSGVTETISMLWSALPSNLPPNSHAHRMKCT